MIAVVAGATGLVGNEVLKLLLEDPSFTEVIVYVRRDPGLENPRLKVVKGELSEMNSHRDELKGDVYFSCLGTTIKTAGSQENFRKVDQHAVVTFGRIAFSHKAKRFLIVSASGAHSQSKIFYNRVKGEAEKALKDIGHNSLVIFRPGLLIGDRQEKRTGEKIGIQAFRILRHVLPENFNRKVGTDVKTLAAHMVSSAKSAAEKVSIIESQNI